MKKERLGLYALVLTMAFCMVFLLQIMCQTVFDEENDFHEMHFAVIVPLQDSEKSGVWDEIESMAHQYQLDIQFHAFSTVAEQKQMLRVLAATNVDGVLFWPSSANSRDYQEELTALRDAGIPLVVMERDIGGELRDSYIGSGTTSDLMVLNQSLKTLRGDGAIVVGNLSGSGSSQVVELLFFSKGAPQGEVVVKELVDKKLCQLVEIPPDGYQATDYMRLERESAQSLNLKYTLIGLFSEEEPPELFFSLDNNLSAIAISAKKSSILRDKKEVRLLCYGEENLYHESMGSGILDSIVTPRPGVSASIGIRYLRDIYRDFWVPETIDSGIDLLTYSEGKQI